jgi:hypothetical protein
MVAHPSLVSRVKTIKQPYNVTVQSDVGAQAAIRVRATPTPSRVLIAAGVAHAPPPHLFVLAPPHAFAPLPPLPAKHARKPVVAYPALRASLPHVGGVSFEQPHTHCPPPPPPHTRTPPLPPQPTPLNLTPLTSHPSPPSSPPSPSQHRAKIFSTQVAALLRERDAMVAGIVAAFSWLRPIPTDANFVLFEVLAPAEAAAVVAALRKRGVLVRFYPHGPLAGYLRISAPRPQDTEGLMAALHAIHAELGLAPSAFNVTSVAAGAVAGAGAGAGSGAGSGSSVGTASPPAYTVVLFDMDGVLVNVAGSYRAAIVSTAARFGVTVTGDDIEELKAAGNANNDWVLTHKLVARGGGSATLDEVTAAFEELYQGTGAWEGRHRRATCVRRAGVLCAVLSVCVVCVVGFGWVLCVCLCVLCMVCGSGVCALCSCFFVCIR